MKKLPLFAILVGLLASPAAAATADAFQGLRAEVRAGYDSVRFEERNNAPDTASGVSYGVGVGGDLAFGSFVVGLEAGADLSTAGHCFPTGVSTVCEDARRDLEVGLRAGFAATEQLLIYGKAGYTNLHIRTESRGGPADFVARGNYGGVRVGAGLENRLGERAYAKVEYRYSIYGEFQDEVDDRVRHQALIGVGLRF